MQQASGDATFTPLVVLELASDTKEEAITWLLSRIRDLQKHGGRVWELGSLHPTTTLSLFSPDVSFSCCVAGAELLVEQLGPGVAAAQEKENPNVFLVGATRQRLLAGAEELGLFKEFKDGSMRGFTCATKDSFTDFKGKDPGQRTHCGPCPPSQH